ncbi:DUF924 family protein [Xanthobacteraceae bacterium A53D]
MSSTPSAVVTFWKDAGPDAWFKKDEAFDARFRDLFLDAHFCAARGEYAGWNETAEGALALMILLDQFPRNAFRGTGHMFATDPLARCYAHEALERGLDQQLPPELRVFLYLPFEHSEDLADQERCVALCDHLGGELKHYAEVHRDIIRDFGRFPHRNPALGRDTTPEEAEFLAKGGFGG